jgi:hypothetical protein
LAGPRPLVEPLPISPRRARTDTASSSRTSSGNRSSTAPSTEARGQGRGLPGPQTLGFTRDELDELASGSISSSLRSKPAQAAARCRLRQAEPPGPRSGRIGRIGSASPREDRHDLSVQGHAERE